MRPLTIIVFLFMLCNTSYSYDWPLYPTDEQHRITGTFGECRGIETRDHVHAGLDMDIPSGADDPVYPVREGVITDITIKYESNPEKKEWWITIDSTYSHTTQYGHIDDVDALYWNEGDTVTTTDAFGFINTYPSQYHTHLHFIDDVDGNEDNPLFYLFPFTDTTNPVIQEILIVEDLIGDSDEDQHEISVFVPETETKNIEFARIK